MIWHLARAASRTAGVGNFIHGCGQNGSIAASTVPLVSSVLGEGESYGQALIQRVRAIPGGRIEWTEGMLYPVLHWMEVEGLIESEWREAETGRRRKYNRLLREGRKALQLAIGDCFASVYLTVKLREVFLLGDSSYHRR